MEEIVDHRIEMKMNFVELHLVFRGIQNTIRQQTLRIGSKMGVGRWQWMGEGRWQMQEQNKTRQLSSSSPADF